MAPLLCDEQGDCGNGEPDLGARFEFDDADGDGLSNSLERELAEGLVPAYHVSTGEGSRTGFVTLQDTPSLAALSFLGQVPAAVHYRGLHGDRRLGVYQLHRRALRRAGPPFPPSSKNVGENKNPIKGSSWIADSRVASKLQPLWDLGDARPWAKASRNCGSTMAPAIGVYFAQRGPLLIVLLAGGDKRTQDRDIQTALALARNL